MKAPTWQYFTLDEYRQRLDALRVRMEARGVDLMLVHAPETGSREAIRHGLSASVAS